MAKTFFVKRTPVGTNVVDKTLACVHERLKKTEKQHGRLSHRTLTLSLLLAAVYCMLQNHEKAVPLLERYLEAAKKNRNQNSIAFFWASALLAEAYFEMNRYPEAMTVSSEAKSVSRKLDLSAPDPLFEVLEQLALSLDARNDLESRQQGLAAALMALCWCVNHGWHRTQAGAQALDRIRLHFSTYGIVLDEWRWLVKHAHLTRYDFIGLLSIVLGNADLSPVSMKSWREREPRVIELR